MKLYISTASHTELVLELRSAKQIIASRKINAAHKQAEKLLPELEALLKRKKFKLSDISEIIVENKGEGFTSLRIGVTTANALAYATGAALAIPGQGRVRLAAPVYGQAPSITRKK